MAGGSNRHVAIAAGSLAVLLGALDTYVVVTIMTDMMKDPPDGIDVPDDTGFPQPRLSRGVRIIRWQQNDPWRGHVHFACATVELADHGLLREMSDPRCWGFVETHRRTRRAGQYRIGWACLGHCDQRR